MKISKHWTAILLLLTCCCVESFAGTYFSVDEKIKSGTMIPYAITHPLGYDGTGGVITFDLCIDPAPGYERWIGPLQSAIAVWNSLSPTNANCPDCILWEDATPPPTLFHAETTLLHEMGHCAMGLDHINIDDPGSSASYTKSVGATSITDGNGVRGDSEDVHAPAANVQDMSWFRKMDNNPFVIDATVVDLNTFSRSVAADLPLGHNYAASANRAVALASGSPGTQAVMYSRLGAETENTALTADDVNMVKMGMTGADLIAGTVDDYQIMLRYRATCDEQAEIQIYFENLPGQGLAFCEANITPSFPQGVLKFHWSIIPLGSSTRPRIGINTYWPWDYGDNVFSSGFEAGDLSEWSSVTNP